MIRLASIVIGGTALALLAGCAAESAPPEEEAVVETPTDSAPEARPWGDTPAEQFAIGTWQCDLFLDGTELPYGVVIALDDAGRYSVEVGGSGAFQVFSLTVADGEVLALGEPGEVDAEVGQTARVEGVPTEVPAAGESVTITRFPESSTEADVVATISVEGDLVRVENPTFGADEMVCARG